MTVYPGAIDSDATLYLAKDNALTRLTQNVSSSDTVIHVETTSEFAPSGIFTIFNDDGTSVEKIYYGSKTATTFTNLTRPNPQNWVVTPLNKPYVGALISEDYHNALKDAIIAIEQFLGDSTTRVELRFDPTSGLVKTKDPTRSNKELSVTRELLHFGRRGRNQSSQWLRIQASIVSSTTGVRMIRDATITGLSVQCSNSVNADFFVRKNSQPANLIIASLNGSKGSEWDGLNVDLDKGDYVQVYMKVNSGRVSNPVLILELAYRF